MSARASLIPAAAGITIPPLSIIICTYNRARLLTRMLDSIKAQGGSAGPCEIIVVDNNSTDDTRDVVERFAATTPGLRYVFEAQQGLSHARNRGAGEATFEHLMYLDDDGVLLENFLGNLGRVLGQHDPDLYGGPIFPIFPEPPHRWFPTELEVRSKAKVSGFSHTVNLSGGSFGIKKSVFNRLGGFDTRFGMIGRRMGLIEERVLMDLYRRATPAEQQKVFYIVECVMLHETRREKTRLSYQLRRSFLGKYIHAKFALQQDDPSPWMFFAAARSRAINDSCAEFVHLLLGSRRKRVSVNDWVMFATRCALRFGTAAGALSFILTRRNRRQLSTEKVAPSQITAMRAMYVGYGTTEANERSANLSIVSMLGPERRRVVVDCAGRPWSEVWSEILSKNLTGFSHVFFAAGNHKLMSRLRVQYPHLKFVAHIPQSPLSRFFKTVSVSHFCWVLGAMRRDYLAAKCADYVLTSPRDARLYWPLLTSRKKIRLVANCTATEHRTPV